MGVTLFGNKKIALFPKIEIFALVVAAITGCHAIIAFNCILPFWCTRKDRFCCQGGSDDISVNCGRAIPSVVPEVSQFSAIKSVRGKCIAK